MSKINFAKWVNETVPLESLSRDSPFHIVNVVSTVELLPPGQSLSLQALALQLPGIVKFVPKKFAAAVMRVRDSIGTTTCLIFRSGKIVVVGASTQYHSLYACHTYRKLIESVDMVYSDAYHRLGLFTLAGRTLFEKWGIWNIVAKDTSDTVPDLLEISKIACDLATWSPEHFPALILLVWLKNKSECQCKSNKKNRSCDCNARVLLFDNGNFLITGCKTIKGVQLARSRIKFLLSDEDLHDKSGQIIPKHLRYKHRRKKCLGIIEFAGWSGTQKKKDKTLINGVSFRFYSSYGKDGHENDPPLVRACKRHQPDNVRHILSIQDFKDLQQARELQGLPLDIAEMLFNPLNLPVNDLVANEPLDNCRSYGI